MDKRVLVIMATSSLLAAAASAGVMGSVLARITGKDDIKPASHCPDLDPLPIIFSHIPSIFRIPLLRCR